MLAKPLIDLNKLPKGNWLTQPKLNGIRAKWHPELKALITRNGNPVLSCNHIIEQLKTLPDGIGYDGELYLEGIPFQELNGAIRRQKQQFTDCQFIMFDIETPGTFKERASQMADILGANKLTHIKRVQTGPQVGIEAQFYRFLTEGYEGIILRERDSLYVDGRKGQILKYKPVFDMEATLVGLEPTASKHAATFGALLLQIPGSTRVFTCSGLSDKDRAAIHKAWTTKWRDQATLVPITVEYGALSTDGVPIFPRFKSIRWDI